MVRISPQTMSHVFRCLPLRPERCGMTIPVASASSSNFSLALGCSSCLSTASIRLAAPNEVSTWHRLRCQRGPWLKEFLNGLFWFEGFAFVDHYFWIGSSSSSRLYRGCLVRAFVFAVLASSVFPCLVFPSDWPTKKQQLLPGGPGEVLAFVITFWRRSVCASSRRKRHSVELYHKLSLSERERERE